MAVIERELVSDQIFRRLTSEILGGRYAPGEKLPTQRALASELGVNMASIREAVKRLEQMRLIEVRQGDAMRVRDWRLYGNLDIVGHLIYSDGHLDQSTLGDILEARRLTLKAVTELAASRCTKAQARRLHKVASEIERVDDIAVAQLLDWSFFQELVEAADNVVFRLIINSIREPYFALAELFAPLLATFKKHSSLYRKLAEAVAEGDTRTAVRTLKKLVAAQEEALTGAVG